MPHCFDRLLLIGMMVISIAAAEYATSGSDRQALAGAASCKRGAIVIVNDEQDGRYTQGCFIDSEGLAVLNVFGLSGTKAPRFSLLDGTELEAPRLKYLDAKSGLLFALFNHRPKVWIEPRKEPVPLRDEPVAILPPWHPPLIGPVWARVSYFQAHDQRPNFQTVMSIAAAVPRSGMVFGTGAPVIDKHGQLCGFFLGSRGLGSFQQQLLATPTDLWSAAIDTARMVTENIPLPLPAEVNPIDPATNHPDFNAATEAMIKGDSKEATLHLSTVLKDHPRSHALICLQLELAARTELWDLDKMVDTLKPSEGSSIVQQIHYLSWLGAALERRNDIEGAEKALIEAIRLSPEDYSAPRGCYSAMLERMGRWDEALRETRAAVKSSPENIEFLYRLKRLLGRKQLWNEEDEVTQRIYQLENLYSNSTMSF